MAKYNGYLIQRAKPQPDGQKWFDFVIREAGPSRLYSRPVHVPASAAPPSVPTTRHQELIIAASLEEVDTTLVALGRSPARIGRERIRLLNDADYRHLDKTAGDRKSVGFIEDGRIYLHAPSQNRAVKLAANLTHELAHAVGLNGLVATAGGRLIGSLYNGLCASAFINDISLAGFEAVNEVATEMLAHDFRLGLINRGLIAPSDVTRLKNHWRRGTIVGELADTLMGSLVAQCNDAPGIVRTFILDYLTGTGDVFALLAALGIKDELMATSDTPEDIDRFLDWHAGKFGCEE